MRFLLPKPTNPSLVVVKFSPGCYGGAAEDFVSIGCKIMTEISNNVMELVTKMGRVLHTIDLI